jgi:hypothetical protein
MNLKSEIYLIGFLFSKGSQPNLILELRLCQLKKINPSPTCKYHLPGSSQYYNYLQSKPKL